MDRLLTYLRRIGTRRIFGSLSGNFFIAVGISIFKFTQLGNDPSSAMVMAAADRLGVSFSLCLLVVNIAWFSVELLWGRRHIGIGTFINWLLIGPVADAFIRLYDRLLPIPPALPLRILVMLIGVMVVCFGVSLYQTSDSGVSPYDALSICLSERLHLPYFWCRIATDGVSALAAWLLGGVVGLGTLVCALGLGPIISLFDRTVSRKLLYALPDASKTPQA